MRAAGVEVAPAEVVVRVPRVGRQREQGDAGGRADSRAHDEEGVVAAGRAVVVDLEDDLVVARPPVAADVDGEGGRPVAPVARRVDGHRVVAGLDARRVEHDDALSADARHLDRYGPAARRRQVQPDATTRLHRLRPAVPRHRRPGHAPDHTPADQTPS
jgi:hypothetical protein